MTKPPSVYRAADHEPSLRIPDEVTGEVHVIFGPKERRNGSPAFVIEIGGQPIDLLILSELQNGAAERSIGIELRWLDAPSPISSSRDFSHLIKHGGGGASALSSLTFARKVGPIWGESRELEAQFELTDRDGLLASSPVPLIVEQAKVCLTQSRYGNVAHEYVVVDGPVILRNACFELESNDRDSISLLRCEAGARPGFYGWSGFSGRALDVEIHEGQTLALMDPTSCQSLCLEDKSVVLVADGTHIQDLEGAGSSTVKVFPPKAGGTNAVRVDTVANVSVDLAGDTARDLGIAEFHVRERAAKVGFSNRTTGLQKGTVSFADGAVGQDISFHHGVQHGGHVTLQTGEGSRLSGVSGTVAVTSLRGSVRGAEEDGFSICRFMDTSPESQPFSSREAHTCGNWSGVHCNGRYEFRSAAELQQRELHLVFRRVLYGCAITGGATARCGNVCRGASSLVLAAQRGGALRSVFAGNPQSNSMDEGLTISFGRGTCRVTLRRTRFRVSYYERICACCSTSVERTLGQDRTRVPWL